MTQITIESIQKNFEFYDTAPAEKIFAALGRVIADVALMDNALVITFQGGGLLRLVDEEQNPGERHMMTDDDLSYFRGGKLLNMSIGKKSHTDVDSGYHSPNTHTVAFLDVTTDKGVFTMQNHAVHNGYYGHFDFSVYN